MSQNVFVGLPKKKTLSFQMSTEKMITFSSECEYSEMSDSVTLLTFNHGNKKKNTLCTRDLKGLKALIAQDSAIRPDVSCE